MIADYIPGRSEPLRVLAVPEGRADAGREPATTPIPLADYPDLLTADEAAHYLRMTPGGVRGLIRRGVLPGLRIGTGRGWRVSKRELAVFLATRGKQDQDTQ